MRTSSGGSTWSSVSSAVTGLNVPAPTASVRSAISTPRARIDDRISSREVESRGRRRDRERLAREDGLVCGAVLGTVERAGLAPDVRRQRGASDPVEEGVVERAVEGHGASPVLARRRRLRRSGPRRRGSARPSWHGVPAWRERASGRRARPAFRGERSRRAVPRRRGRRAAPAERARRCGRGGLRRAGDPEAPRSVGARRSPVARSSAIRRLDPRGRASCAIRSAGSS